MTSFNYKYQNPSGFACLILTRAIVIFTPLGIQNLNKKRKANRILVFAVKWRHRESFLLLNKWVLDTYALTKIQPRNLTAIWSEYGFVSVDSSSSLAKYRKWEGRCRDFRLWWFGHFFPNGFSDNKNPTKHELKQQCFTCGMYFINFFAVSGTFLRAWALGGFIIFFFRFIAVLTYPWLYLTDRSPREGGLKTHPVYCK